MVTHRTNGETQRSERTVLVFKFVLRQNLKPHVQTISKGQRHHRHIALGFDVKVPAQVHVDNRVPERNTTSSALPPSATAPESSPREDNGVTMAARADAKASDLIPFANVKQVIVLVLAPCRLHDRN